MLALARPPSGLLTSPRFFHPLSCCLVPWHAVHVLPEHCCRQIRLGPLARPCAAIQHAEAGLQLQKIHHGIPGPHVPPASSAHPQSQASWTRHMACSSASFLQQCNLQASSVLRRRHSMLADDAAQGCGAPRVSERCAQSVACIGRCGERRSLPGKQVAAGAQEALGIAARGLPVAALGGHLPHGGEHIGR